MEEAEAAEVERQNLAVLNVLKAAAEVHEKSCHGLVEEHSHTVQEQLVVVEAAVLADRLCLMVVAAVEGFEDSHNLASLDGLANRERMTCDVHHIRRD
jgi:CYTH domain-containing protein